jgi:hypothetical protein
MSGVLSVSDYTRIYSNDGNEFVLESRVVPKNLPTNLNYPAKIVECIIQYLYYKFINAKNNINKLPGF